MGVKPYDTLTTVQDEATLCACTPGAGLKPRSEVNSNLSTAGGISAAAGVGGDSDWGLKQWSEDVPVSPGDGCDCGCGLKAPFEVDGNLSTSEDVSGPPGVGSCRCGRKALCEVDGNLSTSENMSGPSGVGSCRCGLKAPCEVDGNLSTSEDMSGPQGVGSCGCGLKAPCEVDVSLSTSGDVSGPQGVGCALT